MYYLNYATTQIIKEQDINTFPDFFIEKIKTLGDFNFSDKELKYGLIKLLKELNEDNTSKSLPAVENQLYRLLNEYVLTYH